MSVNKYNSQTGQLENLASGQRTWVGTKAAYKNAKQAGTLPNNAIIAITDDEVDHNHYSTDEVETGMYWIDGRPIYRKVIQTTSPASANTDVVMLALADVEHIIKIDGMLLLNDTQHEPINWSHANLTTSAVYYVNGNLMQRVASGRNSKPEYIIVEYIKTTDA